MSMGSLPLKYEQADVLAAKKLILRPEVQLFFSIGKFQDDKRHCTEITAPLFELSYNRKSRIQSEINRQPFEFKTDYSLLGFMNRVNSHTEFAQGEEIQFFSIWVRPNTFNSFLQAVSGQTKFDFGSFLSGSYRLQQFKTDAREEQLLYKLEQQLTVSSDQLNLLLVESQVLELLSLNLERLLGIDAAHKNHLSSSDKESLLAAREILLSRLESPPSLLELSRLIHMNDCKLKRSFKSLFGKTVYEFIREQRMEKAFSLLSDHHFNVSQSAIAVGYSNVSHFAQAFREKYGMNPSEVMRNK